jgi:hypothetical protein
MLASGFCHILLAFTYYVSASFTPNFATVVGSLAGVSFHLPFFPLISDVVFCAPADFFIYILPTDADQ